MRHVFDCWTFSYLHTSQSNLGESWRLCSSRLESYGSTYHPSGTVFARSWAEMILERRASEPNPSSMRIGHSGTRRSSAAVRHHPTTPPTRPPKTTGISAPEKYHHFFLKEKKKRHKPAIIGFPRCWFSGVDQPLLVLHPNEPCCNFPVSLKESDVDRAGGLA